MNLLNSIITISRPINCIITFTTIVTACFICGTIENFWQIVMAGFSGLLVTAAGNIINDYYDLEADKINHPYRILPLGGLGPGFVFKIYIVITIFALISALTLGLIPFMIVVITSSLLYFYSSNFKSMPLIGNLVIALLTGLAFIFGSIVVNNPMCGIFPAIFAFLINLMRELIKDIEDIEGDRLFELDTFPIKFGYVMTVNLISIIGVILILVTIIPFLLKIYNLLYFIIIIPFVNTSLIYVIIKLRDRATIYNLRLMSNLLKIDMAIGILAILLGSSF